MQTNNNQKAAAKLVAAPAGGYKVAPTTAQILDCLRACNVLYSMIADALGARYDGTLSPDDVDAKTAPYLDLIGDITEMLHKEIDTGIYDALSDAYVDSADVIQI